MSRRQAGDREDGGGPRRKDGILRAASGSKLAHQVDELCDTLHKTNRTMVESERMLSEYQDITHSRNREMDTLRDELEQSRDALRTESARRAEHSSSHVLDLLDPSLRATPPAVEQQTRDELCDSTRETMREPSTSARAHTKHDVIDALAEEVRQIREDLWKRDASERQRELRRDMKGLQSDLAAERRHLGVSLQESQQLASHVDDLGAQLDQVHGEKQKVLSQLEMTTRRLDESLEGREDLLSQVEELQLQLSRSEERRAVMQERHGSLLQQCRQQELTHSRLSSQIRDVEARITQHRSEQSSLEGRYEEAKLRLLQKSSVEQTLQDRCQQLQAKLAESVEERECLLRRVGSADRECSDSKAEVTQLRAELRGVTAERSTLQEQVCSLEQEVRRDEGKQERLNHELRELSAQLSAGEEKQSKLVSQLEAMLKRLQYEKEEKETLRSRVGELGEGLQMSERRRENLRSQALQSLKKYKLRCRQFEQEMFQLNQEKDETVVCCEALQRQLQEYHSRLDTDEVSLALLRQENTNLKSQVTDLEAQSDQHKQQYQRDLLELQSQKHSLAAERRSLKQELLTSQEQQRLAEERLSSHLHHSEECSQSERTQLQHELRASRAQNKKVLAKLSRLAKACQTAKANLAILRSQEMQWTEENNRLTRELEQVQQALAQREHEISDLVEALKLSHGQEVEHMQQKHRRTSARLEQQVTQLQLQLADKESTVRAVRRQHFRTLGDHQRMGDDLSRSVEDTEKLRRKYLRAKRFYEEKATALESELAVAQSEEVESLRRQLADSQAALVQHIEDHETILRATTDEVDALVQKIGRRVSIPVFPTVAGLETDARKWIADMLAKLQWLQKETEHVLLLEEKLRRRLHERCEGSDDLEECSEKSEVSRTPSGKQSCVHSY